MKDKSFLLLLVAFTLLVFMHNASTPIFEAPDEIWHYAYVRWMAEGHGLPAMDNNESEANQEVAQPPLYYAAAALLSAPFPDDDLRDIQWNNPGFGHQAPGTIPDNKNMLIHTSREHWPWRGAVLTIHVTRLASLLFGLATITAAWGLGHETFGTHRGARITAMLVTFHPQFVFMSSVISNDSAAAALSTAALWSIARIIRHGATIQRAFLTGILVGLAALTKTSVILLIPLAGAALLWASFRHRQKSSFIPMAAFVCTVIITGGWWYGRNLILYGDPLGIANHANTPWGRAEIVPLRALLPEIPLLLRSFWAAYGWGHVTWPNWIYWALWICALALMARGLRHTLSMLYRQHGDASDGVPPSTAILLLALAWCTGILAALLRWMQQVEAPHGRLLFPAIGAWALLLAHGLRGEETASRKYEKLLSSARVLLIGTFILTALAPGARILATFSPPRTRTPIQVARQVIPVDMRAGQAQLLGVEVDKNRAAPGETFNVKACWQALAPMDENYTVFVHLIGPENSRVAERHTYPGLGRFPTTLWPVGEAFCDVYRVQIESWAESPVRYRLEIGLFNAETGARLPATHTDGTAAAPPIVGTLNVVADKTIRREPTHPITATLQETIILHGYDGPLIAAPGDIIDITLYWEAAGSPEDNFTTFVHLWQPDDPAPIAQHDAPARNGWYPTTVWESGDNVMDKHTLVIPSDLPAGIYPLWAGMYHPGTGVRLYAIGPNGRYPHDLVPLGVIEVK